MVVGSCGLVCSLWVDWRVIGINDFDVGLVSVF